MHRRLPLSTVLTLLLAPLATAQVGFGAIAMTGFSTTTFGIFRVAPPVQGYTTPGFGGTGFSHAILWDPAQPQSFLIGGEGFVGRATVTAPGVVSYSVLSLAVNFVAQLSWDSQGQVVVADFGTAQVHRLDPATGALTPVTSGPQPWGIDLAAGAIDRRTGDIVCGGNGALWRIPSGSTAALPLASGLGGFVSGVAFDPHDGSVYASVLTSNRVVRVANSGAVSDVCPPFSVPGPNALDLDAVGNLIVGGGTGEVYRVPRSGGNPVFLISNTQPFGNVNGIAVVGGGGYARGFGSSCAGAFGPVTLRATGALAANQPLVLESNHHAASAPGFLVLGLDETSFQGQPLPRLLDPLLGTQGCWLNTSAEATLFGIASASGPGVLSFALNLGAGASGIPFFAQHVALEPVPGGLSFSNGLALRLP